MKAQRYFHVAEETYKLKAKNVIEVGTWTGERALEMASAAVANGIKDFYYTGFDMFDAMTPAKAAEEFNVKRSTTVPEVRTKVTAWNKAKNVDYVFHLIAGDTRDTLPAYLIDYGKHVADLAWIDGGHSVATIESDWDVCAKLVRPGGVILLDDFYSMIPEESSYRFGCNRLVESLKKSGLAVEIFPEMDPVKGGGFVQIAKVTVG